MGRIRRTLAGLAVMGLALGGLGVVAPQVSAFSGAEDLRCRIYLGDSGTGASPGVYSDTFQFTAVPALAGSGQTVTLTLSGANGPVVPNAVNASTYTVLATVELSGAQGGQVGLASPASAGDPYPVAFVPAFSAAGAWSAVGSYVATGGFTTASLKQLKFDDGNRGPGSGVNADSYCSDSAADQDHKANPAVSTAITTNIDGVVDETEDLRCRIYLGDSGTGASPGVYSDTFDLTAVPAYAGSGQTVTLTLSGASGPVVQYPVNASTYTVLATVELSGAQGGQVGLASPASAGDPYPVAYVSAFSPAGAWSAVGTFVATDGITTASLKQLKFDDGNRGPGSGLNADSYCSDSAVDQDHKANPAVSTAITTNVVGVARAADIIAVSGQSAGVDAVREPLPASTGYPQPTVIDVQGTGWGAGSNSADFAIAFCDPAGTQCDSTTGLTVAGQLQTSASGELSGSVELSKTGTGGSELTTGYRAMRITQTLPYSGSVLIPIQVLPQPAISLSPAFGGFGQVVNVFGYGFNPLQDVTVAGFTGGDPSDGSPAVVFSADATSTQAATAQGNVSQSLVINDQQTQGVVGWQGSLHGGGLADTVASSYYAFLADLNGDGIADNLATGTPDEFNDGAGTFGSITNRAGNTVSISNVAAGGVRIQAYGNGETEISMCGGAWTLRLPLAPATFGETIATCGSLTIEVLAGPVEVVFGGGQYAVTAPTGATAFIDDLSDGSFAVENLGGEPIVWTGPSGSSALNAGGSVVLGALTFTGYASPVDNGLVNRAKAGQTIPLKFSLSRDGSAVLDATVTLVVRGQTCGSQGTYDEIEEYTSGDSKLINFGDGSYQFNVKTAKSWAGSCKQIGLRTSDGVVHWVDFSFR